MTPTFKEVAHFYLGVKCQTPEGIDTLKAVYDDAPPVFYNTVHEYELGQVKPILKRVTDLVMIEVSMKYHQKNMNALVCLELLKSGYDIFNLIDNDQAIEEK